MPHLPYSIELQDSEIAAIDVRDGAAIIRFSHAYVHKDGKGWSQAVDLPVRSARVLGGNTRFPAKVAGWNAEDATASISQPAHAPTDY